MILEDFEPSLYNGIKYVGDVVAGVSENKKIESLVDAISKKCIKPLVVNTGLAAVVSFGLRKFTNYMISDLKLTPLEFIEKLKNGDLPTEGRIVVDGNLRIKDIEGDLPDNLTVNGDLDLSGCINLVSLSDNLTVNGNLDLSNCTSLTSLSDNLTVEGDLRLSNCTSLTSLSDNLTVEGDLRVSGCTSLVSLSVNLAVKGYLILSNCENLTSLSVNLTVKGCVFASNCTSLVSLPDNLIVDGDLRLSGCTSLISLPDNIIVGENLYLNRCRRLASLPDNLTVFGDLDLTGCTSLTSLPNSITEWGHRIDGRIRNINFTDTGLSETILTNLEQSAHPGIRFHTSRRAFEVKQTFQSIEEGLKFWAEIAQEPEIQNLEVVDHPTQVLTFLNRLTSTKEYENLQSRLILARRVIDVFQLMCKEHEIKEQAVNIIFHGLASCDDRIISAFNEVELMIRLYKIEKGNHSDEELREIAKGFLFLEMVNEKAKEHVNSLSFVDEIEVYLAFQIGLADRFQLPIRTRHMIFRSCAAISDEKIQEAGNKIEEACTHDKLEAFLQKWSPWVKRQKESEIIPYNDLPIDSEVQLEEDTICLITQEKPELPVSYKGVVYDYEPFVSYFKSGGKNPMDASEKIEIKLLKKVII